MQTRFRTEAEKRRLVILIGGLAVIALVINSFFFRFSPGRQGGVPLPQPTGTTVREKDRTTETPRQPTAEEIAQARAREETARKAAEAAAAHEKFLAKYLNSGFVRKTGVRQVALIAASTDGELDRTLAGALLPHFQRESVEVLSSLFKPAFVTDKLFDKVFEGSTEPLFQLDLWNALDSVILARERVRYTTDTTMLNLITANLEVEVTVLPVSANGQSRSWKYVANGAGFKQPDSRHQAEERILKQLSQDTRLSLN
jgi:hypothetical protein